MVGLEGIQILAKALRQRGMSLYQAEISFYTNDSDRLMASLSFREKLGAYVNEMYWEDAKGIEHEFDVSRFTTTDPVDDVMEKIDDMIKALLFEVPTVKEREVA